VWLLRHGVGVSHGRAYHPQTQGKEERFHRSLKAEVLERNSFADLAACQLAFDRWRRIYNHERPHEALGLQPPVLRYRPSPRTFCESLPSIE
jgi:transposase InsO family protein